MILAHPCVEVCWILLLVLTTHDNHVSVCVLVFILLVIVLVNKFQLFSFQIFVIWLLATSTYCTFITFNFSLFSFLSLDLLSHLHFVPSAFLLKAFYVFNMLSDHLSAIHWEQHHYHQTSSMGLMIQSCNWATLQKYKRVNILIQTATFSDSTSTFSVGIKYSPNRPSQPRWTSVRGHSLSYPVLYCGNNYMRFSFFQSTIVSWNGLPMETTMALTLAVLHVQLQLSQV